jgi:hypothetical protein
MAVDESARTAGRGTPGNVERLMEALVTGSPLPLLEIVPRPTVGANHGSSLMTFAAAGVCRLLGPNRPG